MSRSFYGRAGASVTVDEDVIEAMNLTIETIQYVCLAAVLEGGGIIHDRAYELANVSPGVKGHAKDGRHMRDCIDVEAEPTEDGADCFISIDLGNVPYAVHQEFGPHGKPFLRPALDETREEVHARMKEVVYAGLGGDIDLSTAVRFRRVA